MVMVRPGWHGSFVSYYRDLSPCTELGGSDRILAVGWLAPGEPFASGPFPDDLLACLLCRPREVMSCGTHWCELCMPTANDDSYWGESQRVASGSSDFLVAGDGGITYAAPELIYHYIRDHGYAPPEEFTAALRASCAHRSAAEVRIATRRHSYECAVKAFDEELEALRIAFTHPTIDAERFIFGDLRAKTKFGRLKQVEDVEAILLHRAPGLSGDEARDATAQLWAAWHRFLDQGDSDAEWLQLSGPPRSSSSSAFCSAPDEACAND
jgi:hypothetical protein